MGQTRATQAALVVAISVCLTISQGCQPEDRYSAELPSDKATIEQVLDRFEAQPVRLDDMDEVYLSTHKDQPLECARCHQKEGKAIRPEDLVPGKAAHWDITVKHAPKMECENCHNEQTPSLAEGVSATGQPIAHAYLICGNCHMLQLKDWKRGAHGKRLSGWHGPRVIGDCVHCHDPHAPAMEKERPVAPPKLVPDRARRDH